MNRASPRWNTVGVRLAVATVLPLVVVVLAGFAVYRFQARPFILDEYGHEIDGLLDLKGFFVDQWLDDRLDMVEHIAAKPEIRAWNLEEMAKIGSLFVSSFSSFSAAVFVDPDGYTAVDSNGPGGGYVGDRTYFQKALAGRPNISDVLVGRVTGRKIVIFAAPARDFRERVVGVVFAPVSLDVIETVVADLSLSAPMLTHLIDHRGQVVATNEDENDSDGDAPPVLYTTGNARAGLVTLGSGRQVLRGRREIASAEWSLVVTAPVEALTSVFRVYNNIMLLTLGGVAFGLAIVALWFTRSIVRPLNVLEYVGQAVRNGTFDTTTEHTFDRTTPVELRNLLATFTEMARAVDSRQEELRMESLTDPLTGLGNRRFLEVEGEHVLHRCSVSGRRCSVLVLDLDHFKRVNDTHGHERGDDVLIAFSRALRDLCRGDDMVVRHGGEEFVALLPGTPCDQAVRFAERVRATMEAASFFAQQTLTVSIGAAEVEIPTGPRLPSKTFQEALTSAIAVADEYLYAAKRNGRNQVRSACVSYPADG